MNRFSNLLAGVAVAAGLLSCSKDETTGPTGNAVRVLFIGNSLTYTNDLPRMVEAVAAAAGASIITESIAYPNYALIDHWNDGLAQETIRTGNFDYVVLQQGPSTLQLSRDTLRLATGLFAPGILQSGAVPALFSVWPEIQRFEFMGVVAESYRLAAEDVGGIYLPVTDTWANTFAARPDAPLYGDDGYHPGVAGTYAAAVVMVSVFSNRDPGTFSFNVPGVSIGLGLMETIHSAAQAALATRLQLR